MIKGKYINGLIVFIDLELGMGKINCNCIEKIFFENHAAKDASFYQYLTKISDTKLELLAVKEVLVNIML